MAIDKNKRYEFVTSSCRYHNEKIIQAFQLFLKLTTAVVAGIFYLSVNSPVGCKQKAIVIAANFTEGAICTVAVLLIIANLLAWWGFRNAESEIVGKDESGNYTVPKPKFPKSCLSEIVMVFVVLTTFFMFSKFNPL